MADAAQVDAQSSVLEIGGGLGILSEVLAKRGAAVSVVELDRGLLPLLQERLSSYPRVSVVEGDALAMRLEELVSPRDGKVVANLPYYVTSPLLARCLELGYDQIVVMIQKEVADRLKAAPATREYGSLTVLASYYGKVERLFTVPPNRFYPSPDVESAVVRIVRHPKVDSPPRLFSPLVRWAFRFRRKTLARALAEGSGMPVSKTADLLRQAGIDPERRGETLSTEEFIGLSENLEGLI